MEPFRGGPAPAFGSRPEENSSTQGIGDKIPNPTPKIVPSPQGQSIFLALVNFFWYRSPKFVEPVTIPAKVMFRSVGRVSLFILPELVFPPPEFPVVMRFIVCRQNEWI